MDHLNTEIQRAVLLSLKVSFCTVICYEEEIKVRTPFFWLIYLNAKQKRLGLQGIRLQRSSMTDHTTRSVYFNIFYIIKDPQVRKLLTATFTERHSNDCWLENPVSHVWPREVNGALQRYMVLLYYTCCWKSKFCIMLMFLLFWRIHFLLCVETQRWLTSNLKCIPRNIQH